MKRQAILVGCRGVDDQPAPLDWVDHNLERYRSFLESKSGGEWHSTEITILPNPSSQDLLGVTTRSSADYTFVVFSGYGSIETYSQTDTVSLSDKKVAIGNILTSSPRQTIIFEVGNKFKAIVRKSIPTESIESLSQSSVKGTRDLFDRSLENTPEGIILIFSALPGEIPCVDLSAGGCFSLSLILSGKQWGARKAHPPVLTIDQAVNEARKILHGTFSSTQNPEMAGQIRRLSFPPFAIGAF